jgi:outer membrane murein-binding lipoprotein Lpp
MGESERGGVAPSSQYNADGRYGFLLTVAQRYPSARRGSKLAAAVCGFLVVGGGIAALVFNLIASDRHRGASAVVQSARDVNAAAGQYFAALQRQDFDAAAKTLCNQDRSAPGLQHWRDEVASGPNVATFHIAGGDGTTISGSGIGRSSVVVSYSDGSHETVSLRLVMTDESWRPCPAQ